MGTDDESDPDTYYNSHDAASHALPAWFIERMMDEGGLFALKLITGQNLVISRIEEVHRASNGSLWLDVELAPRPNDFSDRRAEWYFPPTEKYRASVNLAHVVAAFELSGFYYAN